MIFPYLCGMEEIRSFTNQRMNLDADDRLLSPDETREIYNGIADIEGTMRMLDGNTLVPFDLPAGDNEVIGTCNDSARNAIIYFVKNSLGNHSILRYRPNVGIDKVLYSQPVLNFTRRINHANVIGDLLYWTDGYDVSFSVDGNTPPRKINLAKAIGTNYPHTVTRRYQKGDFASQDGKVYEYINEQAGDGVPVYATNYWQLKGRTYEDLTEDRLYWILDRIKYPREAEAPVVFYTDNPPAEYVAPEEPPVYTPVKYGLLYNWYAATDGRNICADGWELPTDAIWTALRNSNGGFSVVGGLLKETGTIHWENPNTSATNTLYFNAKGAGIRAYTTGNYQYKREQTFYWAISNKNAYSLLYNSSNLGNAFGNANDKTGYSIRLIKTTTTLSDGETGTYTGNDGKVYRTICIGTHEWLADNLCETKYRNGDAIPEVTDNAAWAALTTGALCAYDNDWSNVIL